MLDVWFVGERLIIARRQGDVYDIVEVDDLGAIIEEEGLPQLPEGARRLVPEDGWS